ncbi:MAG: hypothetical protein AUG44_20075 [Actinobacteria bacterium 13_1_20CM_3_71_11]|nr:MAG: hypothetical protein AUG44_20075 [Actinobacteria bacterium 13_1_20CM_3_71_11]
MKVLLTACPSQGHLFLPVPLAWALRNSGHEVLYALPDSYLAAGSAAGLPTARLADLRMDEVMTRAFAPLLRQGLAAADPAERNRRSVLAFAEMAETISDDLVGIARAWSPDLILAGALEFAGPLAAAVTDTPLATYGWGTWLSGPADAAMRAGLGDLYGRFGADPAKTDPQIRVDMCPPRLADASLPPLHHIRYIPYNGTGTIPDWVLRPAPRARVCVTLGSSVGAAGNPLASPLLSAVLAAVDGQDFDVILALGEVEVEVRLPDNVRVVRWLPLAQMLPSCAAIVHHGGYGTGLTAAINAVPQLVLPQVGDSFRLADRIAAAGAGIQLMPADVEPGRVRDALSELRHSEQRRDAAVALQADIAALPGPAQVVPALEALARGELAAAGTRTGR